MRFISKKYVLAAAAACTILSSSAYADGQEAAPAAAAKGGAVDSLSDALSKGDPYLNFRYRWENVSADNFAKDANASTLRSNLGYKTGSWNDLSALLEFQNVTDIGDGDFNDTINGKTTYPTVADPASTEVNQAYVSFKGISDTTVDLGRKALNLDNERFVGSVDWRQNDQTLDSISLTNTSIKDVAATYVYVDNVNRIFSDDSAVGDFDTETHIANVSYTGFAPGKLTAYGYFLDLNDFATLSSRTLGLRFNGKTAATNDVNILYTAEYAQQADYAENTRDFDLNYYLGELGAAYSNGASVNFGYESLEGDGTTGLATPLATLHAHNGWADQFLTTPANGLIDVYGKVAYKFTSEGSPISGSTAAIVYHDFSAENGSADYGTEWDAMVKVPFAKNYYTMVKYSDYDADSFSVDTEKFWFVVGADF